MRTWLLFLKFSGDVSRGGCDGVGGVRAEPDEADAEAKCVVACTWHINIYLLRRWN